MQNEFRTASSIHFRRRKSQIVTKLIKIYQSCKKWDDLIVEIKRYKCETRNKYHIPV